MKALLWLTVGAGLMVAVAIVVELSQDGAVPKRQSLTALATQ